MTSNACTICESPDTFERELVLPPPGPVRERLRAAVEMSDDKQRIPVVICRRCQHARRVDIPDFDDNLDVQREFFDRGATMPGRAPRWPERPVLLAHEVKRLIGTGGRALDIGCGTGKWLRALGDQFDCHGVELSPAAADVARRFTGADIFCGPLEQYQAEGGRFRLITAFALIEHLHDPHVLVQWAYDHLAPGGLFVFVTGDRCCDDARRDGDAWAYYWIEEHISFFSGASLVRIAERAGFDVVRCEWRWQSLARPYRRRDAYLAKAREIARMITTPRHDAAYVYARKSW